MRQLIALSACLVGLCLGVPAGAQISGPQYNPAAVAITGGTIAGINPMSVTGLITASNGVRLIARLVSVLPECNAGRQGNLFMVSDALTPTYGVALVGGGAVGVLALCDGTAWTAH